jgi:hypothetical protein
VTVSSFGACGRPGIASIDARIHDDLGRPTAIGAIVTIRKRGYELSVEGFGDSVRVSLNDGRNESGTFEVLVRKPWHQDVRLARVEVPGDACGVKQPKRVDVTLPRLPNAPAVRQVVLPPGGVGLNCGFSVSLLAHVEADDTVSKAVTWVSGDTLVATVSADGRVTASCGRPPPDYTFVYAMATANVAVKDSVNVGTIR